MTGGDNVADGSLIFDTRINQSGFNSGVSSIGSGLKSVLGTLTKIGAAVGVAFGVKQLVDFGKSAISAASDLQEVQNVVDTAFGEMAYKMEAFANTALETYGISKTTAKQTASTYMAMATSLGLSADEASDMSLTLTGLTADMASFYNIQQEVADTAIKSVFTGETETLKRYGIVMTEANLSAFALSQGINKSLSEMTQAEKVQLRYAYVMEQTALAQGDFAKTSDGWANQTRMLSEKWNEFSTIVGNALMQVALPVLHTLNDVMDSVIEGANAAYNALAQLFGWEQSATSSVANNTEQAVENQQDMTTAVNDTNKALKQQIMGFDEINKLSDSSATSSSGTTTPSTSSVSPLYGGNIDVGIDTKNAENKISGFISKIQAIFDKIKKWIDKNFKPIFDGLANDWSVQFGKAKDIFKGIFEDIKGWGEPLTEWFAGDFTDALATTFQTVGNIFTKAWTIVNKVIETVWPVIDNVVKGFLENLLPVLTQVYTEITKTIDTIVGVIVDIFLPVWEGALVPAIQFLGDMWTDVFEIISNVWAQYGEPIFNGIRDAIINTKDCILMVWEQWIQPVIDNFITMIKDVWDKHMKPLWDNIATFVAKLVEFVLMIYNSVIKPIVDYLTTILKPLFVNVFGAITDILGTLWSFICDIIGNIMKYLSGLIDFLTGVFTGDLDKMLSGLKDMVAGCLNGIIIVVEGIVNLIIDGVNALWRLLYSAVADVGNGIGWIVEQIGDLIGQDWGWEMPTEPPLIPHINIPKLATGTVVPASNGEFLAMLGDNKRETEVVSPLSTMKQALMEALAEYGGGEENITLNINLDGQVIYKDIVKRNKQNTRKSGVNALG